MSPETVHLIYREIQETPWRILYAESMYTDLYHNGVVFDNKQMTCKQHYD